MHSPIHLTRSELAARWRVKPHALDNLAARRQDPRYIRVGRQALYLLDAGDSVDDQETAQQPAERAQ